MGEIKIGIVIVTFNRINKLKISLEKYNRQTYKPQYILVVNNNSSDGTKEYLQKWENEKEQYKKYIINLEQNIGGSGGFYTGLEKAKTLDADWIWVADDDAYPQEDALEQANKISKIVDLNNYSAICGEVINNGKIDLEHRRRIKKKNFSIKQYNVPEQEYEKDYFNIDLFSYVGTIINKKELEKVGSTIKDFFIYSDDTEHAYRLRKSKPILCVPKIKINHDTTVDNKVSWKKYYATRNRIIFYKKHFPKRYFYYEYGKEKIKQKTKKIIKILLGKDYTINILQTEGLKDAKKGKLGLHEIYRPGWKPEMLGNVRGDIKNGKC